MTNARAAATPKAQPATPKDEPATPPTVQLHPDDVDGTAPGPTPAEPPEPVVPPGWPPVPLTPPVPTRNGRATRTTAGDCSGAASFGATAGAVVAARPGSAGANRAAGCGAAAARPRDAALLVVPPVPTLEPPVPVVPPVAADSTATSAQW